METSSLSDFLNKDALMDLPVEKPGPAYLTLCESFPLRRIKDKKTHAAALSLLTKLSEYLQTLDRIPSKEKNQILDYLDALGLLVEAYEKRAFAANLDDISGAEVLEFLIKEHSLRQSDLAKQLGSQSIVSEILSGKRHLNSQQILAISKRFGVSPSAFFP